MVFPFKEIDNYQNMLSTIAWYNFVISIILITVLGLRIEQIQTFLYIIPLKYVLYDNPIFILSILISIIIAFISRIIKLHDKLSDIFSIRYLYDIKHILTPLIQGASVQITEELKMKICRNRNQLMNNIFYKYASSTKDRCVIDFHNVTMALTQFTGLWILLEIIALLITSAIISSIFKDFVLAAWLLVVIILSIVAGALILKSCVKYTNNEVDEILSDAARINHIKKVVNAL